MNNNKNMDLAIRKENGNNNKSIRIELMKKEEEQLNRLVRRGSQKVRNNTNCL